VSFASITLCVASQRVIPKVSAYFVIDSVRKLLNTPSYESRVAFVSLFPGFMHAKVFSVPCGMFHALENCGIVTEGGGATRGAGMKMRRNNRDEGDVPCTPSATETPFQDPRRSQYASRHKWHMSGIHKHKFYSLLKLF
jgi:hypothetical protein